jgi:hypothetical protein
MGSIIVASAPLAWVAHDNTFIIIVTVSQPKLIDVFYAAVHSRLAVYYINFSFLSCMGVYLTLFFIVWHISILLFRLFTVKLVLLR